MTTKVPFFQRGTVVLLSMLCGFMLTAQNSEIPKLDFLVGTWDGTGWKMTQHGKEYSAILETVQCRLDCSMFIVDGLGTKTDSVTMQKTIVHEAFGVIVFDKAKSAWMMRAYTTHGVADSEIAFLSDRVISWQLILPDTSIIQYTVDFNTEGKWIETGEMTRDGKNWFKILEMTLTKK